MTFPKDKPSQESYLQALETRMDTVVQNAQAFVYSKSGKEPNQMEWEAAWVADGSTLPIPLDKLLYWYDPEAEVVRGIYSVIRDTISHIYSDERYIGYDWTDSQEGISRSGTQFRWEVQTGEGNLYWEDEHHIRVKADKYDYDTNLVTNDRDIRIYMDGTIEEIGAWSDTFDTLLRSGLAVDYGDDTYILYLNTGSDFIQITTAPSIVPVSIDLRDFETVNFSATGDATSTNLLTLTTAVASSGWQNYPSMNTARGFMIFEGSIDIDPSDGICQLYWGCGSVPASVGGADGYELVFDRNTNQIDLYFNATLLYSISYTLTASTLSIYLILDLDNDRVTLLDNGVAPVSFILNYTDTSRVLPGTNIGFGGYKAGAAAGFITISAAVGAMPDGERLQVVDASLPEMMIHDFTVYVRYNHGTSAWTLYGYDEVVPSDWIENPAQEAYLARVAALNANTYDISILREIWEYQQSTGYEITDDTVSSFSFRKYPFFQWLDELVDQAGGFPGGARLIHSPSGGKAISTQLSTSNEWWVICNQHNLSTGKIYRLNEWTDGKTDIYKISEFLGDGAETSFTIDLSLLTIPDDYDCLMLKVGNNGNTTAHDLEIQFNGDTGANYSKLETIISTSGADVVDNSSVETSVNFGYSDNRDSETDPGETEAFIYEFRGDAYKSVFVPVQYSRATVIRGAGATWRNTDAITSINVVNSTGATFDVGFYLSLYAVRTKGRHHREGQLDDYNMA